MRGRSSRKREFVRGTSVPRPVPVPERVYDGVIGLGVCVFSTYSAFERFYCWSEFDVIKLLTSEELDALKLLPIGRLIVVCEGTDGVTFMVMSVRSGDFVLDRFARVARDVVNLAVLQAARDAPSHSFHWPAVFRSVAKSRLP